MTTGKELPQKNEQPVHLGRVVSSADLLKGERVLLIQHEGEQYRLMITRNGKLILQK